MEPIAVLYLDGQERPAYTPGEIVNLIARGARKPVRSDGPEHPLLRNVLRAEPARREPVLEPTAQAPAVAPQRPARRIPKPRPTS